MSQPVQSEAETLKLLTLGRLISGVVHELNNPVGTVLAFSQILLDEKRGAEELKALKYIEQSAQQCRAVLERLQRFARPSGGDAAVADLGQVAEQAVALCRPIFHLSPRVKVSLSPPSAPLQVKLVASDVSIALTALLTAVLQALPEATGTIAIKLDAVGGRARLEVTGQAAGVPAPFDVEVLKRLVASQQGTFTVTLAEREATYLMSFPQHRDAAASTTDVGPP